MLVRNKTIEEQKLEGILFGPYEVKEVDVEVLPGWAEEVKPEKKAKKKKGKK